MLIGSGPQPTLGAKTNHWRRDKATTWSWRGLITATSEWAYLNYPNVEILVVGHRRPSLR